MYKYNKHNYFSVFDGGDFYILTLCIVTSYIRIDEYRRFGGICYFHLQD